MMKIAVFGDTEYRGPQGGVRRSSSGASHHLETWAAMPFLNEIVDFLIENKIEGVRKLRRNGRERRGALRMQAKDPVQEELANRSLPDQGHASPRIRSF
jgi:hypothetical protein